MELVITHVGCIDSTALNWSGPSFTIDDGSCLYCNLSGSSFVVDASANGAANGWMISILLVLTVIQIH